MDPSLNIIIDNQITYIQQALNATKSLKEKCTQLESEKNEALQRCTELEAKIKRLSEKKCTNCNILLSKLNEEKKNKEIFKKAEKEKLLKTIAKTLENLDDNNTNQLTNAYQLVTQLVCDSEGSSPDAERRGRKRVNLMEENDSEYEADSKILVNETVVEEIDEMSNDCNEMDVTVVVPETEPEDCFVPQYLRTNAQDKPNNIPRPTHKNTGNQKKFLSKENRISPNGVSDILPIAKKTKCSPVSLAHTSTYSSRPGALDEVDSDKTLVINQSTKSPSVLLERKDAFDHTNSRLCGTNGSEEDKATRWKMKPNVLVENNAGTLNGKKMKQMTLSLAKTEKKQDISLSGRFKGGVAGGNKHSDENDVILPSPERRAGASFVRNNKHLETIEDPDLTVFNPGITSTCLPAETSYDRLPEVPKSPKYKYRREALRKREERLKLPGQDCDECKKYYEAAGVDVQEIKSRLNTCSRHRDKYQIRANTPPGFWDPVLPTTPEGSQELY